MCSCSEPVFHRHFWMGRPLTHWTSFQNGRICINIGETTFKPYNVCHHTVVPVMCFQLFVCIPQCLRFQLMLTCVLKKASSVLTCSFAIMFHGHMRQSLNRLQSANLMCVQRAERQNTEIEVILVWTQLLATACWPQLSQLCFRRASLCPQ